MTSEEPGFTDSPSPGERLRERRAELGISLESVSNALLIPVGSLKALEDNRYEELPGLTYIIGYWRSYANILDIDISDEIRIHKDRLQSSDTLAAYHLGQQTDVQHRKSRKVPVILFVLLFTGFLGGLWYWQKPMDTRSVSLNESNLLDDAATPVVTTSPVLLLPKSGESEQSARPAGIREPAAPESEPAPMPEPEAEVSEEPEPAPTPEPEPIPIPVPEPEPISEPISISTPISEPVPEAVLEPALAPDVPEDSQPVESQAAEAGQTERPVQERESHTITGLQESEPGFDQGNEPDSGSAGEVFESDRVYDASSLEWLRVDVHKTVWIDIRNGRDEKLVFRTVEEGENLEINGEPPFYVYIGSPDGVDVFYLGEPVETPPHSSGQSARFVVGKYPESTSN